MKTVNLNKAVEQNGVIAIVRGVKACDILSLFNALYEGGITVAEITFGKFSDEQTFEQLKLAIDNFSVKMKIGAGSVITLERAKLAVKAGVEYIVSPVTDGEIARFAIENNVQVICGGLTPNEIFYAYKNGASLVKVFPAGYFGPNYIKDLAAPLGKIPLVCFGSITTENAGEYIKAGAVGVGVGSALIDLNAISRGDFDKIKQNAQNFCTIVSRAKNNK